MEEVERSALSVEEAVEAALAELGATEQEVTVQILQEPRAGFGGLGSEEAVVRVRLRARREEASELLATQRQAAADVDAFERHGDGTDGELQSPLR